MIIVQFYVNFANYNNDFIMFMNSSNYCGRVIAVSMFTVVNIFIVTKIKQNCILNTTIVG